MGRIIALDYGKKRTGIATTDPLQIIATSLCSLETPTLLSFLNEYKLKEGFDEVIVGYPRNLDGSPTHGTPLVENFVVKLKEIFPETPIHLHDERFTSKMAVQSMIASGVKKKDRQIKSNIDKVSAVIILQSYLESK